MQSNSLAAGVTSEHNLQVHDCQQRKLTCMVYDSMTLRPRCLWECNLFSSLSSVARVEVMGSAGKAYRQLLHGLPESCEDLHGLVKIHNGKDADNAQGQRC